MCANEAEQQPDKFENNLRVGQFLRELAALIMMGMQATGVEGVFVVTCVDCIV
jgi:hypothetical protein